MEHKSSDTNVKIAKNTVIVYIRLFVVTIIGLLSSRFVLRVLGVSDYGLYNIVGGVISLFAFISGSLSTTSIRFLNVEIPANRIIIYIINGRKLSKGLPNSAKCTIPIDKKPLV